MPDLEATERLVTGMNRLGRALTSSAHKWERLSIKMRRVDVTVLRWLSNHGESRPAYIAASLGVNPSVISRQLTSLEAEGLVSRRIDPGDARAGLVRLSDRGIERLTEVNRAYVGYVAQLIEDWDDATAGEAADLLLDLSERIARDASKPDPRTA